jgi:hypothetical protein
MKSTSLRLTRRRACERVAAEDEAAGAATICRFDKQREIRQLLSEACGNVKFVTCPPWKKFLRFTELMKIANPLAIGAAKIPCCSWCCS